MSLFCAAILVLTVFIPYSYGFTKIEFLSQLTKLNCPGIYTEKLDQTEYESLLTASEDFMVQRFGQDPDEWNQEDFMDANDMSQNPGANMGKNQFFLTAGGTPVRIFDIQRKVSRGKNDACYLSNVLVNGFMSYSLRANNNIRFCNKFEGGEEECGAGYTPDVIGKQSDNADNAQKIINIQSGIDEKLNIEIDENNVDKVITDIELHLSELDDIVQTYSNSKNYVSHISLTSDDKDKIRTYLLLGSKEIASDVIGEKVNRAITQTGRIEIHPFNTIESTESVLYITSADTVFIFPATLATYMGQFKELLEDIDYWNTIALVVTIGSIIGNFASAKAAKGAAQGGLDSVDRSITAVDGSGQQVLRRGSEQLADHATQVRHTSGEFVELGTDPKTGQKLITKGDTVKDVTKNVDEALAATKTKKTFWEKIFRKGDIIDAKALKEGENALYLADPVDYKKLTTTMASLDPTDPLRVQWQGFIRCF